MTRIAVIADIHGNLPALDAALDDIADQGVDEVLVAGDLVGRGPQGSAVVRRVREAGLPAVRGNHEDYLLSFRRREVPEGWLEAREWAASRWMAAELTDDDEAFLDALPFTMTSPSEPELRLFHGSPRSYNEGLGHWTARRVLLDHLGGIDEHVLVCAHTHRAGLWEFEEGIVANVGSVGLPFNGDPRAQYAIFEGSGRRWSVRMRQVDYDRDAFLETYRSSGFYEAGGATARLLELEVRTARPHLVPFLKWAEFEGVEPVLDHLAAFLDSFDPTGSLRDFIASIGGI